MKDELIKLIIELSEKSYEIGMLVYGRSFPEQEKQLEGVREERAKIIGRIKELLIVNELPIKIQ
jgi:hypothetical protein